MLRAREESARIRIPKQDTPFLRGSFTRTVAIVVARGVDIVLLGTNLKRVANPQLQEQRKTSGRIDHDK